MAFSTWIKDHIFRHRLATYCLPYWTDLFHSYTISRMPLPLWFSTFPHRSYIHSISISPWYTEMWIDWRNKPLTFTTQKSYLMSSGKVHVLSSVLFSLKCKSSLFAFLLFESEGSKLLFTAPERQLGLRTAVSASTNMATVLSKQLRGVLNLH